MQSLEHLDIISLPQESFLGKEGDLEVVPDKHVDNIHFPFA